MNDPAEPNWREVLTPQLRETVFDLINRLHVDCETIIAAYGAAEEADRRKKEQVEEDRMFKMLYADYLKLKEEMMAVEQVLTAHRRFHDKVGCPSSDECYVCQAEQILLEKHNGS